MRQEYPSADVEKANKLLAFSERKTTETGESSSLPCPDYLGWHLLPPCLAVSAGL